MDAENAYLFRHALLRDAAYSLQVPSERAVLHELALELIEQVLGGRAPTPTPLDQADDPPRDHPTDPFASELASHARAAGERYADVRALYLHRAAAYAEAHYESEAAQSLWLALAESGPRADALRRAGLVAFRAGRVEVAEKLLAQALKLAGESGNRRCEGIALGELAGLYGQTGRMEQGMPMMEKALAIHRELGNRRDAAGTMSDLGSMLFTTGKAQAAIELFSKALEVHRETGDSRAMVVALMDLGIAYAEIHEYGPAEKHNVEALQICRDIGDRRNEGVALGNLGLIWMDSGKRERVEAAFVEALRLHREVAHRRFEGVNECDFALCLWLFRRNEEAERHFTVGMEILREINDQIEIKHQIRRMHHVCKQTGANPLVF
jgi:tetratricopeptide (TPR) repeat protein